MKKPKAPKWLLKQEMITQRQWRARKRRQLRALESAVSQYQLGCAYTPGYHFVGTVSHLVSRMRQLHSVKAWGR